MCVGPYLKVTTMAELYEKHVKRGITDAQVRERLTQLAPVVRTPEGYRLVDINGVLDDGLWSTAYLWSPKLGDVVPRLGQVGDSIKTVHTFGAPSFWKPTLGEVIAQIDPVLLRIFKATHFVLEMAPPPFQFTVLYGDGSLRDCATIDVPCETLHAAGLQLLRQYPVPVVEPSDG